MPRLQAVIVNTQYHRVIYLVLGRDSQHDILCASRQVLLELLPLPKGAG